MRENANRTKEQTVVWNTIDWKTVNRTVRNLRQRIFRATQEGDWDKVQSLQRLMLRSTSNAAQSVRKVTQINHGKDTPGVDKLTVKSWEARFEASSYGFRPGRSCQDAMMHIWMTASAKHKVWILDADIRGCFNNINHDHLLETIGVFPAKELIRQWLKAGYVEYGKRYEMLTGTPQGGVISPLLANISLHGMEQALNIRHGKNGKPRLPNNYAVIRYADDFAVMCRTEQDALKAQEILSEWLAIRGLQLSLEKTRIVHLKEGFDFLGFNIRFYPNAKAKTGHKVFIKPSKKSVSKIKKRLRDEMLNYNGHNVTSLVIHLNPIIRGWANYFRTQVSSKIFSQLDDFLFNREVRFVKRLHPKKPRYWRKARYFGKRNPYREDKWVFGDKEHPEIYMYRFHWTKIQRHTKVKGTASPDDPKLRLYWEARELNKIKTMLPKPAQLAQRQRGKCPLCGESLFNDENIEQHHIIRRDEGGSDTLDNLVLLHLYCHQQITATQRKAMREFRQ